jgi:hypothetical protein
MSTAVEAVVETRSVLQKTYACQTAAMMEGRRDGSGGSRWSRSEAGSALAAVVAPGRSAGPGAARACTGPRRSRSCRSGASASSLLLLLRGALAMRRAVFKYVGQTGANFTLRVIQCGCGCCAQQLLG